MHVCGRRWAFLLLSQTSRRKQSHDYLLGAEGRGSFNSPARHQQGEVQRRGRDQKAETRVLPRQRPSTTEVTILPDSSWPRSRVGQVFLTVRTTTTHNFHVLTSTHWAILQVLRRRTAMMALHTIFATMITVAARVRSQHRGRQTLYRLRHRHPRNRFTSWLFSWPLLCRLLGQLFYLHIHSSH